MLTAEDLLTEFQEIGPVRRRAYRKLTKYPKHAYENFFGDFTSFRNSAFPSIITNEAEDKASEVNEFAGNEWNVQLKGTRIHTLPELLEYCKVDLSIWEVERFVVNKWEVGARNTDGNIEVTPLYQVKATLVKRKEIVDARAEIERLKAEAKLSARIPKFIDHSHEKSGNMLELTIPDLHIGKLAWQPQTGDRNYNTAIAEQTYYRAVDVLINRVKGYKFDSVTLVIGNDQLNSDDELGRTTKGTFVATDGRYQRTFIVNRKAITNVIERLREIAPVHVVVVRGNHDGLSSWHVGDSLECYFHQYSDVVIDNSPIERKYIRYGNVLIGLSHGDKGKRQDYPLLMATERSKDFGETTWREWHTGHYHQSKLEEFHGVRVRILPSLSPADEWHASNGFTGQLRLAEGFVWNQDEGLIAQFFYNDNAYPAIESKGGTEVSANDQ